MSKKSIFYEKSSRKAVEGKLLKTVLNGSV